MKGCIQLGKTIEGITHYVEGQIKHFSVGIEKHAANGHDYCELYLDEQKGRFTAVLYGGECYSYTFASTGIKFVQFLIETFEQDPGYLYQKICNRAKEDFCDVDGTIENMKKELIKARREHDIDEEEAREIYQLLIEFPENDRVTWNMFYDWYFESDVLSNFYGEEAWHGNDFTVNTYDENCRIFCRMVAPLLAKVLRSSYKAALAAYEESKVNA